MLLMACGITVTFCELSADEPAVSKDNINRVVGREVEGFRLAISTTNNVFQLGQPIHLSISIQNVTTNRSVLPITERNLSFEAIGPEGRSVPETELGAKILHPTIFRSFSGELVLPGRSLVSDTDLTTLFFMTNAGEYSFTMLHKLANGKSLSAGPLKIRIIDVQSSGAK